MTAPNCITPPYIPCSHLGFTVITWSKSPIVTKLNTSTPAKQEIARRHLDASHFRRYYSRLGLLMRPRRFSAIIVYCYAPVAQLDRVGGFEPLGRGFESLRVRQFMAIIFFYTRFPIVSLLTHFFWQACPAIVTTLFYQQQNTAGDVWKSLV